MGAGQSSGERKKEANRQRRAQVKGHVPRRDGDIPRRNGFGPDKFPVPRSDPWRSQIPAALRFHEAPLNP